jgi:predicted ATP-dependent endonuclease of OLD family
MEMLELGFPSYYTAICGKNNSGKTNLVRAIQCIFRGDAPYFEEREDLGFARSFPVWKAMDDASKITIRLDFVVNHAADAELHKFIATFLSLTSPKEDLPVSVTATLVAKKEQNQAEGTASEAEGQKLVVAVDGQDVESYKSQEIGKEAQVHSRVSFLQLYATIGLCTRLSL